MSLTKRLSRDTVRIWINKEKLSPNDYYNKVSNQIFKKLTNNENFTKLNFRNLKEYKPQKITFSLMKPQEFDKISIKNIFIFSVDSKLQRRGKERKDC